MANTDIAPVPKGNASGFRKYFLADVTSGFLVFLIALPLCLGISIASGFPPIAGIFTAIIGAVLATAISNSELTIKGPAAGMIVIVLGCVEDFGGNGMNDGLWDTADFTAYQAALAVGVVAAIFQIVFGIFRAGILGEFFPSTVVHGMLAAIGSIIIIKQFPVALGVTASGGPFEMLRQFPNYVLAANPAIAAIGLSSLLIMFAWPLIQRRLKFLKAVPAPLVVLLVAVPMGMGFDLLHEHSYTLQGHEYQLSENYLVKMPERAFGMFEDITTPDFTALAQPKAYKWVFLFFIIGTLESLLSAKAIDLLDPFRRKSNMDRDCVAVGVANLATSCVGGLPMISEIVRSKANIDNGAKTRFANFWHGMFLLLCVALIPFVLHRIPLAALAAMLVYTGSRLAHPSEFLHVYRIGKEQLAIFVTTMLAVLATDLLIGVAAGIVLKMVIHLSNGVPLKSLFKPFVEVEPVDETTSRIVARGSAVFSNWIPFRRQIEDIGLIQKHNLVLDLSNTQLVDHSVMEKIEEMQQEFQQEGLTLDVHGLDTLRPYSRDALAARKQKLAALRRLTIIATPDIQEQLETVIAEAGASGYTMLPCRGAGRQDLQQGAHATKDCVRFEVVAPIDVAQNIFSAARSGELPTNKLTCWMDAVEVMREEEFLANVLA